MNKSATTIVLLIALLQPFKALIMGYCQHEDTPMKTSDNKENTDITDSKPWPIIGNLMHFFYYNSKLGNNNPIEIEFNDESAIKINWINGSSLKLITHGWLSNDENDNGVFSIKTAYVETSDYNIITLDWSRIGQCLVYPAPAIKTELVGMALADFLDRLVRVTGIEPADIHLIGHSLGAHVVGAAGAHIECGQIGRITGLDPACPGFEVLPIIQMNHLNKENAAFVDVIHTAAGTLGYLTSIGDVDFYPNSGKAPQPGCDSLFKSAFCSHSRSYKLYADSVYNRKSLYGLQCSSWSAFVNQECKNNLVVPMGHDVITNSTGDFYAWTNSQHPFSTYLQEDPNTSQSKSQT